MRHVDTDKDGFALGLERGDAVRAIIEEFAAARGIGLAEVSAIGAVADPELGYYDLARKQYVRKVFAGDWELASLQGNITIKDGKPFLHAHVVLGGPDFAAVAGHLFDAKVAVVVEAFMRPHGGRIERSFIEEVGLHCWAIEG